MTREKVKEGERRSFPLLRALVNDRGNADVPIINRGRSTRAKGPAKKSELSRGRGGDERAESTPAVEPSGKVEVDGKRDVAGGY